MSKTQSKKQHIIEESVEAKPRSVVHEATSLKTEAQKLAEEAVKSTWDNLIIGSGSSISEQLLGSSGHSEQQLVEGQTISLKQKVENVQEKVKMTAEHMEYFRSVNDVDRISENRTEVQVKQAVDEIRMEIQKLIKTSKIVEQTVKDSTADHAPVKPGKYHISFFQFVLSIIRDATSKLEDGVSYGAVFTSKKQQSKYWTSYKKQGTTFGLSGERTTATQTG
ncbi:MAG: hypothetical protein A2776_00325 [Candidatus Levybacteria bacterium RIFCSPHIGHO2_01_FULL_40_10]|nr:MAG: hypothetical protein A2776_00325 [Candidatus Levybacteria bacterium RIFCSPHIGHO2_01_FULL_40_10]